MTCGTNTVCPSFLAPSPLMPRHPRLVWVPNWRLLLSMAICPHHLHPCRWCLVCSDAGSVCAWASFVWCREEP